MSNIRIDVTANVQGAVTGLDQVRKSTQRAGVAIDSATSKMGRMSNQVTTAQSNLRKFTMGGLQQAGYQFGDYAVQVANGTSKMQAFGQQAPQLLQIFGPIGAIVGAAVAIFAAFAVVQERASGKSKNLADAMSTLSGSLGAYSTLIKQSARDTADLSSEFGRFAKDVKGFSAFMAEVNLTAGMEGLKDVAMQLNAPLNEVTAALARVTEANANLAKAQKDEASDTLIAVYRDAVQGFEDDLERSANAIGLNITEATSLAGAIDNIGKSSGLEELTSASRDALQLIQDMVGSGAELPEELRASAAAMQQLLEQGSAALVDSDNTAKILKDTMVDVKTAIKDAADEVLTLGSRLLYAAQVFARVQIAAREARVKAAVDATKNAGYSGRGSSEGAGSTAFERSVIEQGGEFWPSKDDKSKSKSKDMADPLKDLIARTKIQQELIGASKAEQAVRMAIYDADRKYTPEQIANAISLVAVYEEQTAAMDAIKDRTKQVSEAIAGSMENAMMSMVDGTQSVKEAFKSMAAAIIKDLYRIFVVKKITGMISGAIEGYMNPAMPAIAGKNAMGGPMTGGKTYMVGERGPELVVPSRNSHVVPNNQLSGGSGVTVIQNNTFGNGVNRAEINAMLPKIVEASKAAVLDARRRGGSYAGAF